MKTVKERYYPLVDGKNVGEDIDSMMITRSKFMANGTKYFELFEPYIPKGIKGNTLLVTIGNLDCYYKIMSLNKDDTYYVIDNSRIIKSLYTLYGCEFDIKVIESKYSLDTYNKIKGLDVKFDRIIMNPPYQRNLHLKILAEAIKHLKDDNSICVNLSPYFMNKNELHILKNIKKFLYERQLSQIVISPEEMDSLFNIYGSCSGAITSFSKFKVEGMIYPEIEGNLAIVEKLRDKKKAKSIRTMIWKTSGSFSVPVQGDYGYAKRWHYTLDQMLSGNPNAKIRFNTQNEADNFVKTTTTQNIYKFIWYVDEKSAIPAHLPFLGDAINPRTGLKGYQGEWTDEDLYKYFNITPEEQKAIEDTMKKYETK